MEENKENIKFTLKKLETLGTDDVLHIHGVVEKGTETLEELKVSLSPDWYSKNRHYKNLYTKTLENLDCEKYIKIGEWCTSVPWIFDREFYDKNWRFSSRPIEILDGYIKNAIRPEDAIEMLLNILKKYDIDINDVNVIKGDLLDLELLRKAIKKYTKKNIYKELKYTYKEI